MILGGLISSCKMLGSVANGYPLSRTSSNNWENKMRKYHYELFTIQVCRLILMEVKTIDCK
jgi:hypothetical protein